MATKKRLIDANELAEELADDRDQDCNRYQYWYQKEERDAKYNFAIDRVNEAPTVDAVEVVHGRWVHPQGYVVSNGFICSECGHEEASHHPINPRPGGCCIADEHGNFFHPPKINYCPNCGAKMDGDGNG